MQYLEPMYMHFVNEDECAARASNQNRMGGQLDWAGRAGFSVTVDESDLRNEISLRCDNGVTND